VYLVGQMAKQLKIPKSARKLQDTQWARNKSVI